MRTCQLVVLWTIFLGAAATVWFLMATAWYADDDTVSALREIHLWLFVALALVIWFYWRRFNQGRRDVSPLLLLVIPAAAILLVAAYAAVWGLHLVQRTGSVLATWRMFCGDAPWFALKMTAVSLLVTFPAIDAGAIIALRWRRRPPQAEEQLFTRWVVLLAAQLIIGTFLHLGGAAAIGRLGDWAGFRVVRPDLRRYVAEAAASGKYQLCRTTAAPLNRLIYVDGMAYFEGTGTRARVLHVGPPAPESLRPPQMPIRLSFGGAETQGRLAPGWYESAPGEPGASYSWTGADSETGLWMVFWLQGYRDDAPEINGDAAPPESR